MTSRRLWVLGDSWADPRSFAFAPSQGWPARLADSLGYGLVNSAMGGAGYGYSVGVTSLPAQAAQGWGAGADVVILWGSLNDALNGQTPTDVTAGAATALRRVAALCPDAALLVVGPQWISGTPPPSLFAARAAVAAAAVDAVVPFVDPIGWYRGRPDLVLDPYHPTAAGHELIVDRLAHDVALLTA